MNSMDKHLRGLSIVYGDKLTAFAPNTIGIPYFKGKDMQPFSMGYASNFST